MNGFGAAMNGVNAVRRPPSLSLDEQQAAYVRQTAQQAANPLAASAFPNSFGLAGISASASLPSASNNAHQQALLRNQAAVRAATGSSNSSGQQGATHTPTDGGPPYAVPTYQLFTRTTSLDPGVPFPSIDAPDQPRVKAWMARDLTYEKELVATKKARKAEILEIAEDVTRRQDWLGGDGRPAGRLKLRMDHDRTRERAGGKRGQNRKEVKMSKEQLRAVALLPEVLIPIRLEYEHEAYKLRDTLTWNLRETIVTPEIFASHLVEDLRLPYNAFYKEIVAQIKRHIEDAQLTENYAAHLGDDLAAVREDNQAWFETNAKKRIFEEDTQTGDTGGEDVLTLRDFSRQEGVNDELRVVIKLDITLDSVQLVDKFEWDISDPRNSPENFADTFAAELGLSGEFRTAIAHSIREQVDVFTKSLCILGHVQGVPVPDDDLRREFLPSLFEPFRADAADFTPLLNQLTPDEVERNDKEREREVRRKRRQTKGRGVTLPDRDFVKTHRTLVPKPSTVPIHSYQDQRGDIIYPMPEMSYPYPVVLPTPTEKPPNLETVASSPLKLVPAKGTVIVPTGPDPVRPGGSRLKRLKQNGDGSFVADAPSGSVTPAEGSPFPGVAVEELPSKKVGVSKAKKVIPVIKVNLEELGLHEHIINGAWHCANCGVPESAAVGRRKGPSGNNSLCGTCGKFFHRFRRNRPCTYTTDVATHQRLKDDADAAAVVAAQFAAANPRTGARGTDTGGGGESSQRSRRRGHLPGQESKSSAARDSSEDSRGDDSDDSEAPAKRRLRGQSPDLPFVQIGSPDSDMSSLSPSPPPAPLQFGNFSAAAAHTNFPSALPRVQQAPSTSAPAPAPPAPAVEPLLWMKVAAADLRSKQVDDRFEIIPRPRPPDPNLQEWRIRCLDCPGKLYNLGPGETLDNFSVHFKNRVHRGNVEARLKAAQQ